jgi:predicted deacylase
VYAAEAYHCYRRKPDSEDVKLTGDDRKQAQRREQEARVWISGIEAVKRKIACVRKERIKYNLHFDEVAIRVGVDGALSVMRYLRMLPSRRTRQRRIESLEGRSSGWVRAPQRGILRTLTPLGARVEAHPCRLGSSFLRQPVTENA